MEDGMMRLKPEHPAIPARGLAVEVNGMSKRFGDFAALDDVSIKVPAGSFHALLGENGAGKSTLVKCLVGFYEPDGGEIQVDGREVAIHSPQDSHALGIGMVYQHFTLVPSMTVAENLVMSRADVPAVVNWKAERERLAEFMKTVPFELKLDTPVSRLAAGDKQKTEILKQLYLERRFMILDEPTSVLTPNEADEVLGMLKDMTRANRVTVLIITHKFREVTNFADAVTVLRRGRFAGAGPVAELDTTKMAEMMVGDREIPQAKGEKAGGAGADGRPRLGIKGLVVHDDTGLPAVRDFSLEVRPGEIVGIAGVSGNGQKELVEALVGQRTLESGEISVGGKPYAASRGEIRYWKAFSLPEEPLRNACVPGMSVAENMALRNFDRAPISAGFWLKSGAMREQALRWIADFGVKTRGPETPIAALSGGNVQRAVLARELSGEAAVLIAANPVFGLDFAAVAEIHDRILAARNQGAAVLLVSADLDELLELSDRIVVMFEGGIVHETPIASADISVIGPAMAGHGHH
ncbi:MAG TPA: ABC transporter ATP-binding protein [Burkholderiales bacterium]|nr:ABC transporter ATP-binding protein [Burkholderiales bacterium]